MIRVIVTSIIVYFSSQLICVDKTTLIPKRKSMIIYNFLIVFSCYSFFNIFTMNYKLSFFIVIVMFYILSLVMYYVHEFRGTNFNFSDILSINTAKEVASGYKYRIKFTMFLMLLIIVGEFVLHYYVLGVSKTNSINSNNVFNNTIKYN